MQTELVPVAAGVSLAVDRWAPDPAATGAGPGPARQPRATFLLVHGLASNARLWDGVAARLAAAGHEAVAVDLRGHGRSSKVDGPYDTPTVADDLAALIERLGLDRPIAAGQSWGGNVVLDLAARHPAATRGLVLVDGGWLEPSATFADWEACRAALAPPHLEGRRLSEIEGYIRGAHPDWPEAGIAATLANFEHRQDGTIAPWLTFDRHIAVLRGLWEHHPRALYPDVRVPVLLVPVDGGPGAWTDRKRIDIAAALEALPVAQAHWFRGDHDIHAQHPDELANVMRSCLDTGFFA